jgi:polar amino acid transport system substrate-binding protein
LTPGKGYGRFVETSFLTIQQSAGEFLSVKSFALVLKAAILAGAVIGFSSSAMAQSSCAAGKTLKEGVLTIATGEPAYFPWVIDNKPEDGKGFEAAVALEIASRLGFTPDKVTWVRTTFDQAIQPGPKDYDFNLQQYSITEDRAKVIDFSTAYYKPAQAVLMSKPTVEAGAKPTVESLKTLRWGAVEGTTQPVLLKKLVDPAQDLMFYSDVADSVEALKAKQIDAVLMDLPSALYTAAVVLPDGVVLGQFEHSTEDTQGIGLVFEKGNALRDCANEALAAMEADGKLKAIEAEWLQTATGAPLIK